MTNMLSVKWTETCLIWTENGPSFNILILHCQLAVGE